MKVLLVTSMFPPYCGGGVSSHVRDLAEALGGMGHEPWVLTSRRRQRKDPQESAEAPRGTRVVYARDFPTMAATIGHLTRATGFDVVHYHAFNALALAPLARRAAGASVFTLHSDSANYIASVRGWRSRAHPGYQALRLYERIAGRLPDMTIAVSNRMVEYARAIGIDRVVRIPNAVDSEYWRPSGARQEGVERAILVPRMHVPKNGIEYAIDSMRTIAAAVPGARLLITGDGPLRDALERRAASLDQDHVQFLGTVSRDEMRKRFQASDLVMIPSVTTSGTQENTSIAALEAMACGSPVIATRIGGLPEVIEDGRTGVLVPERDAESLAAAAVLLLRDPERLREMRSACRDHVVRRFSVGDWASKVIAVYTEALEANGRPGMRRAG